MKIIDGKGKLFGKVSLIDIFIILLIIASVFIVINRFGGNNSFSGADKEITYTILVEGVREPTYNALTDEKHTAITEKETGRELGNIVSVEKKDSYIPSSLANGDYKLVKNEGRYDLTVTVKVYGSEAVNSYYASSGRQLMVGEDINFTSEILETNGIVTSIKTE